MQARYRHLDVSSLTVPPCRGTDALQLSGAVAPGAPQRTTCLSMSARRGRTDGGPPNVVAFWFDRADDFGHNLWSYAEDVRLACTAFAGWLWPLARPQA